MAVQPQRAPTKAELRKARLAGRERFRRSQKAAEAYGRRLRGVAMQVGNIVKGFAPGGIIASPQPIMNALQRYADLLTPWSERVAARMLAEVAQRDAKAWADLGREQGRLLKSEIANAPTGAVMRQLMSEQIKYITSIPKTAAQRVHKLVLESLVSGARSETIAKEIMKTGHVAKAHATLIARTEAARASSALTQSRAQYVGSEGYIWRTAGDADVRELHKKLEGQFIRYDSPPVAGENGEVAHAGMIYNCRCWQEPVIPDIL